MLQVVVIRSLRVAFWQEQLAVGLAVGGLVGIES